MEIGFIIIHEIIRKRLKPIVRNYFAANRFAEIRMTTNHSTHGEDVF